MQKTLLNLLFFLIFIASAFGSYAYGRPSNPVGGGGGTPEPASILLILGGAAALGIKGLLNKKKK